MNMENTIAVVILLVIVVLAAWYVVRPNKNGQKCIGCPYAGTEGCSCSKK